jgi:hypothetical protein
MGGSFLLAGMILRERWASEAAGFQDGHGHGAHREPAPHGEPTL